MTDYSVPPSLTATLTLEGNDTLTVVPVGSIVVDGDDAVLWDLGTSASVPPGLIVHNQGLIQSLSDRAIDTTGSAGGVLAFTLINEGTVTSPDDAIRINDTLTDGTVVISNYGTIDFEHRRPGDRLQQRRIGRLNQHHQLCRRADPLDGRRRDPSRRQRHRPQLRPHPGRGWRRRHRLPG